MKFEFDTDPDTERLLQIVAHFLQEFFHYDETKSFDLINTYYKTRQVDLEKSGWGDNFYHYEGAWRIATLLHWTESKGEELDFVDWLRNKDLVRSPSTALAYFRTHYFER